jgi:RNA polymerase sigma-70 factor (ECF subfamily)
MRGAEDVDERTDEDLVRRARAGDPDAVAALYARHQSRLRSEVRRVLRGIVRRRVGDSDVVQDAWVAAFACLDEFEDQGPGSFGRWLTQIVRHKARDVVRRHMGTAKRGGKTEVTQGGERHDSAARDAKPTPGAEAVRREEGERLRRAMARLTDDQRTVVECVHRKGMTLVQVGEALGRSPNAVCKTYGRAVQALARVLSEPEAP